MKKIINLLPAMAILLASGLAVASHSTSTTHNVKNTQPEGEPPIWVTIGENEDVPCDDNQARLCTGYMDEFENILETRNGSYN